MSLTGSRRSTLLERKGFTVDDHPCETHHETEAFQGEHGVDTTPQVFIGGERIGGYDDLREHLGQHVRNEGETSYQPVIAIFGVALLMALAVSWCGVRDVLTIRALEWFIAITHVLPRRPEAAGRRELFAPCS